MKLLTVLPKVVSYKMANDKETKAYEEAKKDLGKLEKSYKAKKSSNQGANYQKLESDIQKQKIVVEAAKKQKKGKEAMQVAKETVMDTREGSTTGEVPEEAISAGSSTQAGNGGGIEQTPSPASDVNIVGNDAGSSEMVQDGKAVEPSQSIKQEERAEGNNGDENIENKNNGGSNGEGSDSQGSDSQGNDGQGSDGQGSDGKGSDGKGSDGQGSDGQGSDGKGSDGKGSDGKDKEIFSDDIEPPSMDGKMFKHMVGMGQGGTVVAWKDVKDRPDKVIVKYGPKSHAIYRIESARNYQDYQETDNIMDLKKDWGEQKFPGTRNYMYTQGHFVTIKAVAWSVDKRPERPLDLINKDMKGKDDLPKRFIADFRALVVWRINDERHEWWETRSTCKRVFPAESGQSDLALFYLAQAAEERHRIWQLSDEQGREVTPSPGDKYLRILNEKERKRVTGSPEDSRSYRETSSPSMRATRSPSTPDTSAPSTRANTASPASETAKSSKGAAGTKKIDKNEWLNDFLDLFHEGMSLNDLTDEDKADAVNAWRVEKQRN